jgi:hypothetical protein
MRKAIILIAFSVLAVSSASAALPWNETFSYADGNLTNNPGWVLHSGVLPTDVQVVAGKAVLNSATAPDVSYQFRTQAEATATDVLYASFTLKVTGTQTATGTYFAHFMNTGTFFAGRVFAALNDATTYKLGINTTSGTPAFWPTPLTKGVDYEIAVRYDAATGVSTLWVNPTTGGWTSEGLVGPAVTMGTLVSGFALRQSAGYGVATIDNLSVSVSSGIVATTNSSWGDVKSLFR